MIAILIAAAIACAVLAGLLLLACLTIEHFN